MQAVTSISAQDAIQLRDCGRVLIVDVRPPIEIAQTGSVAGAKRVPAIDISRTARPGSPSYDPDFKVAETIVLYCDQGNRAAEAALLLAQMGYANVRTLTRFADWKAAGGPVQGY
jgi:rhodanese-related sulfurtransferase